MNELHLFAGSGGGILGGIICGATPVCAVEINENCREVLLQRQRDGILPIFPIWDDVSTFDGKPWRGKIDRVCGGFPCQGLSIANPNGKGLNDPRTGLWSEMWRIIRESDPHEIFLENSWRLVSNGLGTILTQLAEGGYNARWATLGGFDSGSSVDGKRLWLLATKADSERRDEVSIPTQVPDSRESFKRKLSRAISATWDAETDAKMRRDPDEMASRMERLKAIGNGQDPILVARAFSTLTERS